MATQIVIGQMTYDTVTGRMSWNGHEWQPASANLDEYAAVNPTDAALSLLDDTTIGAILDTLGGVTHTGTGGVVCATSPSISVLNLGSAGAGSRINATGSGSGIWVRFTDNNAYYDSDGGILFRVNISTAGINALTIDAAGNIALGTGSFPSGGGSPCQTIAQASSAPTGPPANTFLLYGLDVAGTCEAHVRDEGGTQTQISAHAMDGPAWLYDPTDPLPRVVKEYNSYLGYTRWTNDSRDKRLRQREWAGEKINNLPELERTCVYEEWSVPIENWDENQQAEKVRIEAERLRKGMEEDVEVVSREAMEEVEEVEKRSTGRHKPTGKHKLTEAGEVVAEMVEETGDVFTGKARVRLKAGVRFDESTGKFFRRKRAGEVTVAPVAKKPVPAWLAARGVT